VTRVDSRIESTQPRHDRAVEEARAATPQEPLADRTPRSEQTIVHVAGDHRTNPLAHLLDRAERELQVLVAPVAARPLAEILAPQVGRRTAEPPRPVVGDENDVLVARTGCELGDLLGRVLVRTDAVELVVDLGTPQVAATPGERSRADQRDARARQFPHLVGEVGVTEDVEALAQRRGDALRREALPRVVIPEQDGDRRVDRHHVTHDLRVLVPEIAHEDREVRTLVGEEARIDRVELTVDVADEVDAEGISRRVGHQLVWTTS
jgi:hypothetical protein